MKEDYDESESRANTLTGTSPQADTSKWEAEIDQLVYQLYGLTEEEIATVEGKSKNA